MTAANNLTRLLVAMLSLTLLVAVTQLHGYAEAGLLMLVYAAANGAGAAPPWPARRRAEVDEQAVSQWVE